MTIYRLPANPVQFPPPSKYSKNGCVAVGGGLSPEWLLTAYHQGLFPWFNEGEPIQWWSPDPRMVLFPEELKISNSLNTILKKEIFKYTLNTAFLEVIENCANTKRPGQEGTWITPEMINAYHVLHQLGYAYSFEAWQGEELCGGLYGIYLPPIFCGESMFTKVSNASKAAFTYAVQWLSHQQIKIIDCQIYTDHLASLGAREITRNEFLKYCTEIKNNT